MSTSPAAASSLLLSLTESVHLLNEHYCLLSQSLNALEHQMKQYRDRRLSPTFSNSNFVNPLRQTTRRYPDHHTTPVRISSTGRNPSPLQTHRRSFNNPVPPNHLTDIGNSRENPIYVDDDGEERCEGCWEEGHFIGDCNREYRFDGERYMPIREGEYPMEPTYVVDRDYYRREDPKLQAESGKSTTLIGCY